MYDHITITKQSIKMTKKTQSNEKEDKDWEGVTINQERKAYL